MHQTAYQVMPGGQMALSINRSTHISWVQVRITLHLVAMGMLERLTDYTRRLNNWSIVVEVASEDGGGEGGLGAMPAGGRVPVGVFECS